MKCAPRGFTLVELLVAMSVGILVAGSALLALSSAFSSWTRLAAGGMLLETGRAMLRFEQDIASAIPLPDRPFSGDSVSLTLPLERDGVLRVATWSSEESRLVRRERDYLFADEATFDGRAPDGTALPVHAMSYRLPAPARFSYSERENAEGSGESPSFFADSPTNLPRTVVIAIGDFLRLCPARLSAPDSSP